MSEITIGRHVLQPNRQLLLDGEHVHIGPRALSILTALAQADGEVVTKDELMETVWPEVTVEENALQVHVTALRKALGEDAERLHTLRGIGYQLDIREVAREPATDPTADHTVAEQTPPPPSRPRWLVAVMVGGLLALATVVALALFDPFGGESTRIRAPQNLAVMPLQVSGDEEWQSRAEALTASMATNLARVPEIELVSETATKALADQGLSPAQIGQQLGVDHIIESDVLADETRLVAQIRLIDTASERVVWTGEVNGERKYASEFEPLILNRISGVLIALQRVEANQFDIPEDIDPRAYEAFLDGLSLMTTRDRASHRQVLRQMQLAASIEPTFAEAHAGIAYSLAVVPVTFFSMSAEEYEATYQEALDRGLRLDPDNVMARRARGNFLLYRRGDVAEAMRISEGLLSEGSNHGQDHALRANALRFAGHYEEALNHIERAITADPFNHGLQYLRRRILIEMGDYQGVIRSVEECRLNCWEAAHGWWEALSQWGSLSAYRRDIEQIAMMFDDDRAYFSGDAGPAESIRSHGRFLFLGVTNPYMDRPSIDWLSASGITHFRLIMLQYGYVDEALEMALRRTDSSSTEEILLLLQDHRLTPSPEIRADPRYHAIFEIPRYQAVANYRREHGLTAGLPVFPVKPYNEN